MNKYTWKDVVEIDGKFYAEEFEISGEMDNDNVYQIDDFINSVAKKYNVDSDDVKTYMTDNIEFNPKELTFGAEDCGCYINGIAEWMIPDRIEYWKEIYRDNDVCMVHLMSSKEADCLSKEQKYELLKWSGEDERDRIFCRAQLIGLDKIWIFEIQDGACGGFIIANSEEEARKKLSLDRGVEMGEEDTAIYPLTALDLNKDVHDLW